MEKDKQLSSIDHCSASNTWHVWCLSNACVISPFEVLTLSGATMNADEQKRMHELCSAIAREQDSETLLSLVAELNQLFDLKELRLKEKETAFRTPDPGAKPLPPKTPISS
jgi:hypothetical protein